MLFPSPYVQYHLGLQWRPVCIGGLTSKSHIKAPDFIHLETHPNAFNYDCVSPRSDSSLIPLFPPSD
ncbi:hypothetical protein AAHC03_013341 [Spirometra sp. Aus1]